MSFLKSIFRGIFKDDFAAKDAEIQSLKHSLSQEERGSKEKDERIAQLETDAKSLRREVANLKSRRILLEEEISSLKYELEEIRKEKASLKAKGRKLDEQLNLSIANATHDKRSLERLGADSETARKAVSLMNILMALQQHKYKSLHSKYRELIDELETLKADKRRMSDRLTTLYSENDRHTTQLLKRKGKLKEIEDERTQIINDLEAELSTKKSQLKVSGKQLADAQSEIKKLQAMIASLKSSMDSIRKEKENEVAGISKTLDKCFISLQSKTEECEAKTEECEALKENVAELQKQVRESSENVNLFSFSSEQEESYLNSIHERDQIIELLSQKNDFIGQISPEFYLCGVRILKKDLRIGKWSIWGSETPVKRKEKWDSIELVSDNQIRLSNADRVVYLAMDGTISEEATIDEPEYMERKPLPNGYFIIAQNDGYWGLADDENNYAVLPQYDAIEPINEKYLRFKAGTKWGVMSIFGDTILDADYASIESFEDGCFNVILPNEDQSGKRLCKIDLSDCAGSRR